MKLNDDTRTKLLTTAKSLSPDLGNLLQNPIDLTLTDLSDELLKVKILQQQLQYYMESLNRGFVDAE